MYLQSFLTVLVVYQVQRFLADCTKKTNCLKNYWQQDSILVGCVPPACQLYLCQWPPLNVSTSGEGVGPQLKKMEQVFSDGHHMSVAGGIPLTSDVHGRKEGERVEGYPLRSDVWWEWVPHYHVTYPIVYVLYSPKNNVCKWDDIGNLTGRI